MTHFTAAVVKVVSGIPVGRVVSYGQVAAYVGIPRGARQVGWVLRQMHGEPIPWWRVVNNMGVISIRDNWEHDANEQRDRLRKEGVEVHDNYTLDMEKYRFTPEEDLLRSWGLPQDYLQLVYQRFKTNY